MYFAGLVIMIVSMPLSKYMMSVSQFVLAGVLILKYMSQDKLIHFFSRYPCYISIFLIIPLFLWWVLRSLGMIMKDFLRKDNIPAIVFSSLFIMHVIGLIFTIDFEYALKDLRIKLPILVLPILLSVGEKLDRKKVKILMLFFVASVIISTFITTSILFTREIDNVRDISIFISHIRFSLLISIAIFTMVYMALTKEVQGKYVQLGFIFFAAWLVFYLIISTSMTGLIVLFVTTTVILIHFALKKKNIYARIALVSVAIAPIVLMVFIMGIITDVYKVHHIDFSELDAKTSQGTYYFHDTTNLQTENGHYVWLYIATEELREAWNERSEYNFDGKDQKGQELKHTLIRFLTSKGLRKDADGVANLTQREINLIENGEASIHYHERSVFYIRLYKIIWEAKQYFRTGNPSGYSAMQRIEYWKTSILIIKDNLLHGVGTGDMNIAFQNQYEAMDSPLKPEFRWRSHNQFLSITVGFGMIGLIWFLFSLLYPPIKMRRMSDFYYLTFFVILIVSMISEDTIETQAGVTFFAFFTSLFLFGKKDKHTF
jgi:hypothetical protein